MSWTESANRVCFCYCQFCQFCQFCQYSLLRSVWVCIVCIPPRYFQPSNNDVFHFCVNFEFYVVNFCIVGARYFGVILVFFDGSCSKRTLWNTVAEFLPLAGVQSPHFEDTSFSQNLICGFLTAVTVVPTSYYLDF